MKFLCCSCTSFFLFIFGANLIYEADGNAVYKHTLKGIDKSAISRSSESDNISDGKYSSPIISDLTTDSKPRSKVSKEKSNSKRKEEVHVLNQHPDQVSAYEIPVSEGQGDTKKPPKVKKKSSNSSKSKGEKHGVNNKNSSTVLNSSKLSKISSAYSVLDPRTLMMMPLLAAPVVFAEAMTLGGVGLAVPAFLLLPLIIAPLIVISFIMFI